MQNKIQKIKVLQGLIKKILPKKKIEKQIETIKPQSQRIKKVHLTQEQVEQKITKLSEKLKELQGTENKKKRQNIYKSQSLLIKTQIDLAKLDNAKKNPDTCLCDPTIKQQKLQQDKERRIQKKLAKKKASNPEKQEDTEKRLRKKCLICKKKGHLAGECKENENNLLSNVCYYCGKKGHALKDCKRKKQAKLAGQEIELNFATCFVCKKSGHIAKDCPQNDKGIYYKGGSCHLWLIFLFLSNVYQSGSVRHLAADCDLHPNQQKKMLGQTFDNKQEPEF